MSTQMRAGGCILTACAIAGAVLIGACSSADSGPATSANASGGDPAEFCRIVADLNGSDPFAELASARTRVEADAIVDDGMARIARLRETVPGSVHGGAAPRPDPRAPDRSPAFPAPAPEFR